MSSIARTAATGDELDPRFLAWSTSFPVDERLLAEDVRGSLAHVEGLRDAGLVSDDEATTLSNALQTLPERVARGEVVLREDEEDVHMAVEAWLAQEVGDVAGKLHTGRSRNDQVATDLKLWCRGAVTRLEDGIEGVRAAASQWVQAWGQVTMPSYTHRQVAIPVLGATWLEAVLVEPLARDRRLLLWVADELAASPLGAGAIAGTSLPIDAERTASALGFAHGPRNPMDAVGERDYALALVFACARVSLHLGRLCTDVIELASDGLVRLGGAIAGGSSMMPHKRNPDLFELVRGAASLRHGELTALISLLQGLGTGYHRDLQHDKALIFAAVDGTVDCLEMIAIGLAHMEPVPDRCLQALREGDAVATDLCEALVRAGVPFRQAYQRVGQLVVAQRAAGKRLVDLTAADLGALGLPESAAENLDPAFIARRRATKSTRR